MRFKAQLASIVSVLALLTACGGGGGTTPPSGGNPPANSTQGAITGKIVDAKTGLGIAGAKVTAGALSATTDAQGQYTLPGVAASSRVAVAAEAGNYAEGLSVAAVTQGQTQTLVTKLLPLGVTASFANATGGTVNVPNSPAQVVLPPNAFSTTGNVTIELTPINPAIDSAVMPGDFTTANGAQTIESFGALAVTPRDSAGNVIDLAAGQTATIRIPAVSKGGALSPTIPLFYVSKVDGSWVREGTATLAGTAPNQYYEGVVSHFSVWNADQVIETVRFTGCVRDASGAAVSGVRVASDGVDYIGSSSALSDASGNFTVPMKRNATATISGSKGGNLLTNAISKTSAAADFSDAACLVISTNNSAVKIQLSWGANPSDLDSHLFTPNGEEVYFGNPGSLSVAPFANLDVDDTNGSGPEIITINRLMVGTYTYGVNLYSGSGTITSSPTQVELNVGGQLRIFTPTAGETGSTRYHTMFNLVVDARCNVTIVPVGTWQDAPPAPSGAVTPVYCTP
jgi:uncharacterized protein YfaP (DUF2135 family)